MLGRVHVIIDVSRDAPDPLDLLHRVVAGGAPLVQVRVKGLTDREAYEVCAPVADVCRRAGVACVVNDRVDVALAVGAAGVHVGLDDLPVAAVAAVAGAAGPERFVLGGTAREPATAAAHERDGATYLGVGPVYATGSKSGLPDPLGPAMIAKVVDAVRIPVIAIAGVTVERVPELLDAGAHGVAVIGAVARAADPTAATAALVAAFERRGLSVGR